MTVTFLPFKENMSDTNIDIYGKVANNVPGLNTVKTLEKRKRYILRKLEEKIDESSYYKYLIDEIRALEKTMNFIKWIQNNMSNDMVKEIIEQYKKENKEEAAEEETADEEGSEIIGIFHEKFNKNHKLEIVLSINNGIKFVTMRGIKKKKDKLAQEETDKYTITLHKLERVLRRANELENAPETENPPETKNMPDTEQENPHADKNLFAPTPGQREKRRVVVRARSLV